MLYFMRHGLTDWNIEHRIQGSTDIPLNDTGRQMARDAAERYKDVQFDICFVSTLNRADETARIFLEGRDVPMVSDARLKEMDFGIYDGSCSRTLPEDHPIYKLIKEPHLYVPDGNAESFESLYSRITQFLNESVRPELLKGKDVLVIAHGAVNKCILSILTKAPLEEFWTGVMRNCELLELPSEVLKEPVEMPLKG